MFSEGYFLKPCFEARHPCDIFPSKRGTCLTLVLTRVYLSGSPIIGQMYDDQESRQKVFVWTFLIINRDASQFTNFFFNCVCVFSLKGRECRTRDPETLRDRTYISFTIRTGGSPTKEGLGLYGKRTPVSSRKDLSNGRRSDFTDLRSVSTKKVSSRVSCSSFLISSEDRSPKRQRHLLSGIVSSRY